MKNREELQNSIFEKSAVAVRRRRQRRKRMGAAALGLCMTAGIGIYLLGNVFDKKPTEIQLAEGETKNEKEEVQTNEKNTKKEPEKIQTDKKGAEGSKQNGEFEDTTSSNVVLVSEAAKKIAKRTELSDKFIQNTANFSIELFQKCFQEKNKENVMISPLSALLALSMTTNGADNETLSEMESVLGGDLGIEEINQNFNSFMTGLYNGEKTKLFTADSIWFRNDTNNFIINPEFLEINRKYYYADAYAKPFNQETLQEMNQWISEKTEGMFQDTISEISENTMMYLFNTMIFEGEWRDIYYEDQVKQGTFIDYDGNEQEVSMMYSKEGLYLRDENAKGFIKPYENGYSFAALLPNEGVDIGEFIQSLNGEKFLEIMEEAEDADSMEIGGIFAALPKFSSKVSIKMNEVLQKMGIKQAFTEEADFSKIERNSRKDVFISEVLQNSYIKVDETGTQAGAVTRVTLDGTGFSKQEIVLNRPFVYAVIDNQTKLPVYIGAVLNVEE